MARYHEMFKARGTTEDTTEPSHTNGDVHTFAATHTFDSVPQLRRINLTAGDIKRGATAPLVYCKRLTRVYPQPVIAAFREEATSKDGRQHLYRVTLKPKDGREIVAEGWLRIVEEERQKRRA